MDKLQNKLLETCHIYGHFVNASKTHTDQRIEFENLKRRILLKRKTVKALGLIIGSEFPEADRIVTVARGANWMAEPVAKMASTLLGRQVEFSKTIKIGENREFNLVGGNIYVRDENCVILDDVYNFGTNTSKVAQRIYQFQGVPIGIVTVFNRNPNGGTELIMPNFNTIPVRSYVNIPINSWSPEECDPSVCTTELS